MSGSLPAAQTKQLLAILFASKDQSFEASSQALQAAIGPASRFAALCSALLLLQDTKALLLPQRLATWYLLYSTWPGGPTVNPFIGYIFKACEDSSAATAERVLCLQLLTQRGLPELEGRTPQDYALTVGLVPRQQLDDSLRAQLTQRYVCLQQQQQQQQQQQLQQQPAARHAPAGAAVVPNDASSSAASGTSSTTSPTTLAGASIPSGDVASSGGGPSSSSNLGVKAGLPAGTVQWLRPAPASLDLLPGELRWLYPDLHTDLIWDSTLGESGAEAAEVHDLVARALRAPLLPAQQQRVLAALDANPRLVHRLGVLPQHLPLLVEHCPALASSLLLRMLRPWPTGRVLELLGVLARSEMSLHGMEVVNRLAASVELPPEFVHLYITNCINSCVGTQDKYVQSRLVRLVCVFLQSLIRNRILAAMDLLHELQAFCINFSRIREAAKLFRLLKQIEAGGAVCLTPSSAGTPGSGLGGVGNEGPGVGGLRGSSCSSNAAGAARGGAGGGGGGFAADGEAVALMLHHAAVDDDEAGSSDDPGAGAGAGAGTGVQLGGKAALKSTPRPDAGASGSSCGSSGGGAGEGEVAAQGPATLGPVGAPAPAGASCGPPAISEAGRGPSVLAYGEQKQ